MTPDETPALLEGWVTVNEHTYLKRFHNTLAEAKSYVQGPREPLRIVYVREVECGWCGQGWPRYKIEDGSYRHLVPEPMSEVPCDDR